MEEPERSILLFYYSQRFEMFIFIFIRLYIMPYGAEFEISVIIDYNTTNG